MTQAMTTLRRCHLLLKHILPKMLKLAVSTFKKITAKTLVMMRLSNSMSSRKILS